VNRPLTGVIVWITSVNFTRDVTVAYIGVPLNVLVACFIGAYCSFSVGDKVTPRSTMWGLLVACLFMGGAFTAVVNAAITHFMHMELLDGVQAGIGAIVSFITRFFLPWLADVVQHGKWIDWIPWVNKFRSKGE
jgi:hypothetical protein